MTPRAYYNENDPAAAHVLRVLGLPVLSRTAGQQDCRLFLPRPTGPTAINGR